MHGETCDLSGVRVIGCRALVYIPAADRTKLEHRVNQGLYDSELVDVVAASAGGGAGSDGVGGREEAHARHTGPPGGGGGRGRQFRPRSRKGGGGRTRWTRLVRVHRQPARGSLQLGVG
eukprot:1179660-Prorocentrum_minimum.AAC.1